MARRLGTPSSRTWSGGHLEIKERINIALKSTLHRLSVQKLLSSPSQVFQRNDKSELYSGFFFKLPAARIGNASVEEVRERAKETERQR